MGYSTIFLIQQSLMSLYVTILWTMAFLALIKDTATKDNLFITLFFIDLGVFVICLTLLRIDYNNSKNSSCLTEYQEHIHGKSRYNSRTSDNNANIEQRRRSSLVRAASKVYEVANNNTVQKVGNEVVNKMRFNVKCGVMLLALICRVIRGILFETSKNDADFDPSSNSFEKLLENLAIIFTLVGYVDILIGTLTSPHNTPSMRLAKAIQAYRCGGASNVPYIPFDRRVYIGQNMIVTFEILPAAWLIPIVHTLNDWPTNTSAWLVPVTSILTLIVYTTGSIHWRGCLLAFILGSMISKDVMFEKPDPTSTLKDKKDKALHQLDYSLWGPTVMIADDGVIKTVEDQDTSEIKNANDDVTVTVEDDQEENDVKNDRQ